MNSPRAGHRLDGRRIVITGAGSGIGRRTARLFAEEGAALTLIDLDSDAVTGSAREIGANGFAVDVTDEAAVTRAVNEGAQSMGGVDGVVNAAGVMHRGSVRDVDAATWRRVIDINLVGTYIVVRACLPWLARGQGATIVNIGSGQGLLPNVPNRTAYAASKAGVITLTRALAAELAPTIRANCVCPGLVDTPMANGVRGNTGNYALGRLADPLEIAHAILFLSGPESTYVTGATLAVDGGRTFH